MRSLGFWLFFVLFSVQGFADNRPAPTAFDSIGILYKLITWLAFDTEESLAKIGLQPQACQLDNSTPKKTYPGLGPCLFAAIGQTAKTREATSIYLWVKSDGSRALPPIRLDWRHSQSGWGKFIGEFIFLAFEDRLQKSARKHPSVAYNADTSRCVFSSIPNRDLGNFLGNIQIHFPHGYKISDYIKTDDLPDMVRGIINGIQGQTITLSVKVPFYMNQKRVYDVNLNYQNPDGSLMSILLISNYNFISQKDEREWCAMLKSGYTKLPNGVRP